MTDVISDTGFHGRLSFRRVAEVEDDRGLTVGQLKLFARMCEENGLPDVTPVTDGNARVTWLVASELLGET